MCDGRDRLSPFYAFGSAKVTTQQEALQVCDKSISETGQRVDE